MLAFFTAAEATVSLKASSTLPPAATPPADTETTFGMAALYVSFVMMISRAAAMVFSFAVVLPGSGTTWLSLPM